MKGKSRQEENAKQKPPNLKEPLWGKSKEKKLHHYEVQEVRAAKKLVPQSSPCVAANAQEM